MSCTTKILQQNALNVLNRNHPVARRLFRPFIEADFKSPGYDKNGQHIPPAISQEELVWLRKTSYLFGLQPADLNLPEAPPPENTPLDERIKADLKRTEEIRIKKEQRRLRTEGKQKRAGTFKEEGEFDEEEQAELQKKHFRFMTSAERKAFEENKLTYVNQRMEKMDSIIAKWKEERRIQRRIRSLDNRSL